QNNPSEASTGRGPAGTPGGNHSAAPEALSVTYTSLVGQVQVPGRGQEVGRDVGVTAAVVGDQPPHERVVPKGRPEDLGDHGGVAPGGFSDGTVWLPAAHTWQTAFAAPHAPFTCRAPPAPGALEKPKGPRHRTDAVFTAWPGEPRAPAPRLRL